MVEIGYTLSSEEHPPAELVRQARCAEDAGFTFASISDHFHPWTDEQGQSPFVWSVLGGIASTTERLRVVTAVTCPTIRIHPVIVAQAAATVELMMPGRFSLGVGTGENLNEHIVGAHWPPPQIRLEMLAEAIEVLRLMWTGELVNHHGLHYTVERARLYSCPDEPPDILIAAGGADAASMAAAIGDGFIGTSPNAELITLFDSASLKAKPKYGLMHVCWAPDEEQAKETAHRIWPNSAIPGDLSWELPLPLHFEQASKLVTPEKVCESVTCGPDPEKHLDAIRKYADAGYDHVVVHQIGPDQNGFIDFFRDEVLPKV